MADTPKPIKLTEEQVEQFVENTRKWMDKHPESKKPIPLDRLNRSMNIMSGKADWRDPMAKRPLDMPAIPEGKNKEDDE